MERWFEMRYTIEQVAKDLHKFIPTNYFKSLFKSLMTSQKNVTSHTDPYQE